MKYAASRLAQVKPSASASVSLHAAALKAAGHNVIDLGLGEPDFNTPAHIVEAAHQAALNGETRYPPTGGTAALKKAIAAKFSRDNQLAFAPNEIIVSNGAKQVIFNAFMATLEAGDQVLLCAPYFGQYKDIVLVLGGNPGTIACSAAQGFKLTPEALEAAITPATRWVLLNIPSNPAGAVYSKDELRALGAVLQDHPQVMIMSDEIYEHIVFDQQQCYAFAQVNPELKDRTLTVNGVSKAYAMTGWRIGYAGGPKALIDAMFTVQSQATSGACSVAQAAATAALNGPQDSIEQFKQAFEQRRNLIVERIAHIPELSLDPPGGAFYAFIGCAALIGATTPSGNTLQSDIDVTQYFLDEAKVAAVAGSAYDLSPFVRISTASSIDQLDAAMDRIVECIKTLTLKK